MNTLIHLALAIDGLVMAQFSDSQHAAEYCAAHGLTHVPYNLANREKSPAPLVGTIYRA